MKLLRYNEASPGQRATVRFLPFTGLPATFPLALEGGKMKIKNWHKFQHFKDRRPPWIKLYRDLLDDPDWHELNGDCVKLLVNLWMLASEDKTHQGILPDFR